MALSSTKNITQIQAEASEEGQHTLKRTLSATNLVMLGIGAIIGAGIFVLTGTAAANNAGPAVVWSFVLAGLGCLFAGLCYAEFASMIPVAGSAYTYAYATLGEFVAWIIGWDLILEYLFGASTVAVGWSGYFVALLHKLGIHLPVTLTQAPFGVVGTHNLVRAQYCVNTATGQLAVDGAGKEVAANACTMAGHAVQSGILNVPAVVLTLLMTALLVVGIKESARFNNLIVFVKVAIVFLVIGFGFMFVNAENWTPFVPAQEGPGVYGWSGIVRAAGVVFFAYIGFDAVSTAAQEAKNPQRDMPIGMLGSLAFCTVLYILMSLVMTGLVPYKQLNVPHPVDVAVRALPANLQWIGYIVVVGALAGTGVPVGVLPGGTGNLVARTLGTPRDAGRAVGALLGGLRARVDLGVVEAAGGGPARHFAFSAGVGVDAYMIGQTPPRWKRRLGIPAYAFMAARAVFAGERFPVHVTVDGREWRGRAAAVMVVNFGAILGDLLPFGPGILADDGRLDLCVFAPRSAADAARVLARLVRRDFRPDPSLVYLPGERFHIAPDRPQPAQADGELLGLTPLTVRVAPLAATLLVPSHGVAARGRRDG